MDWQYVARDCCYHRCHCRSQSPSPSPMNAQFSSDVCMRCGLNNGKLQRSLNLDGFSGDVWWWMFQFNIYQFVISVANSPRRRHGLLCALIAQCALQTPHTIHIRTQNTHMDMSNNFLRCPILRLNQMHSNHSAHRRKDESIAQNGGAAVAAGHCSGSRCAFYYNEFDMKWNDCRITHRHRHTHATLSRSPFRFTRDQTQSIWCNVQTKIL